jgi:hypothetical protein
MYPMLKDTAHPAAVWPPREVAIGEFLIFLPEITPKGVFYEKY